MMTTELIVIEKASVHDVFTKADKLDPIIAQIRAMVSSVVPDTTTAKGRAEIKSRAYQVTRTKTYLDGLGKDLVAEMKKLPAIVDASRKRVRDEPDTLAEQVRKPLSDWEAEQERLAAEQRAREEADMAHRAKINREVLADLMTAGLTEDQAKAVICAVVKNKVRHTAITY